jgi:hypothetical protein
MVGGALRRVAAVVVTATLLGLVAGDLWDRAMRSWWAGHGLTASAVSSLLVVGVSALIFDELVARRQRKARALSVAVQAVIVFGQTRRAFDAVMARLDNPSAADAVEDVRGLATMLLAASPTFFDDPDALRFLEQVERLVGHMVAALAAAAKGSSSAEQRAKVSPRRTGREAASRASTRNPRTRCATTDARRAKPVIGCSSGTLKRFRRCVDA